MTQPLPPGPELYAHNRRRNAERQQWPDGTLDYCERIDRMNPGWYSTWRPAYNDRPAGYYAHHDHHAHLEREVYAETPGELQVAIMTHDCPAADRPGLSPMMWGPI